MDDGGSILIVQRDMTDAGPLQCESPNGVGYVTALTTGDARLKISFDPWRWVRPWRGALVVGVCDGSLAPGERIEVILGDTGSGSPGWVLQTFPETRHDFRVLVDPFGTRKYRPLQEHPFIRIEPGKPVSLNAVLPSVVKPREDVQIWVRVLDRWDNPVVKFEGDVKIDCKNMVEGIPTVYRIGKGVDMVGTIRFPEEGLYRLKLNCNKLWGQSNPVSVSKNNRSLFWGDLHGQTQDTIGTGTVEEYFTFARDRALIDVTSWQGNDFQITDSTWNEVCKLTKEFHKPGHFITFLGYEWSGLTPVGGDHNIMFLEDDQTLSPSSRWQASSPSEGEFFYPISRLWERFKGRRDVMAVAHVGGRHANLDFWNPELCGLLEIHSSHGTFEWLAEEALQRGLLVGFMGGSDDHTGRPGMSPPLRRGGIRGSVRLDVYGGLTGIYASELTRQAIWEALRSRHCYATTGSRIIMDVRCGRFLMGDVVEGHAPLELVVEVMGTAPLLDVEVHRDDAVVYRHPFTSDNASWVRVDWSGLRVKSRNRRAPWNGSITVSGGRIEEFIRFGFRRECERIDCVSENEVKVESTTSGDMVGVFLRISGKQSVVRFNCSGMDREVDVGELGLIPMEFDAGGLNMKLRFSLCHPHERPESLRFSYTDPEPLKGLHAYWVKVLQMDGHSAWASPIFYRNP